MKLPRKIQCNKAYNNTPPSPKDEVFYCSICNYRPGRSALYDRYHRSSWQLSALSESAAMQIHGIDMEETQRSKLLSDIPGVDVVITMGCNIQCPFLPCSHRDDWGLEDPSGKSDDAFLETIRLIEEKVLDLRERIK